MAGPSRSLFSNYAKDRTSLLKIEYHTTMVQRTEPTVKIVNLENGN